MKGKRYDNNKVLFIGDDHAPFQHRDALKFLTAVESVVEPDRVIHLGDLFDQYCFSRYLKDVEVMDATTELSMARRYSAKLAELFPDMVLLESNHDSRLWERARAAGIPRGVILPYLSLIGCTHGGWKMKRDITLTIDSTREQIFATHYRCGNVLELAKLVGCNAVQGHLHSSMGIQQVETPSKNLFGVQVPCLISDNTYAFAYNKQSLLRPVLGCAVVLNGVPKTVRMNLNKAGRWDGRLLL